MPPRQRRPFPRAAGFALPLTLLLLAALLALGGMVMSRVELEREKAEALARQRDGELALFTAQQQLHYRLLTRPLTEWGLGMLPTEAVRLDNRPYAAPGGVTQRLQDTRGLLSLTFAHGQPLRSLLAALSVRPDTADRLSDTLGDYIDDDSLLRLNGAEAADYRAASRPPPANQPLAAPAELYRVLGWREFLATPAGKRTLDLVGIGGGGFNLNTAPREVMLASGLMNPKAVEAILRGRENAPIISTLALAQLLGQDALDIAQAAILIPSKTLRVRMLAEGVPEGIEYAIELTPTARTRPFEILYWSPRPDPADWRTQPGESTPALPPAADAGVRPVVPTFGL